MRAGHRAATGAGSRAAMVFSAMLAAGGEAVLAASPAPASEAVDAPAPRAGVAGAAPFAIQIVSATWSAAGGWGGERGVCDVMPLVERRCALRRRCALATEPTPCPDPPRPLPGLDRVLTVSFRCGALGRDHVATAVAPDPLLLRCVP